jgi:hypothetical protein
MNFMRFLGTVERLGAVNIRAMQQWIAGIPFSEWPQQPPLAGEMRPAMINDPNWHNFGQYASTLISGSRDIIWGFMGMWRNPMLSVVMPGHYIESHIDFQPEEWIERVHIPLTTNAECCMFMDRAYYMEPGFAYRVNTERRHAIINHGGVPRIHFMFDIYREL